VQARLTERLMSSWALAPKGWPYNWRGPPSGGKRLTNCTVDDDAQSGIVICHSSCSARSNASASLPPTIRKGTIMNRLILPVITASALTFGFTLPSEKAVAQTTAKDLVGTWTLVSITLEKDGKKADFYGPNPQGQLTFDPAGRPARGLALGLRAGLGEFLAKINREGFVLERLGAPIKKFRPFAIRCSSS
jgi:hypothetical protein